MNILSSLKIRFVHLVLVAVLVADCHKCARAACTFGEPTNLGPGINTSYSEGLACIAPDGLSLYFISNRPGGSGNHDLYIATRASANDDWSPPINLGPTVNSYAEEFFSCISYDGLTLYFDSTRSGGRGARDLWGTTRPSLDAPWTSPVNLGSLINSGSDDVSPNFSADGLTLLFSSSRPGGLGSYDIYICTRPSQGASWSAPVNLGAPINSAHLDVAPWLSSDGLILFFHSIQPTGFGTYDLYYSRRQTLDAPWSAPIHLPATVNSPYPEIGPSLSSDGRVLYFCEHPSYTPRPGGHGSSDLWQVSITPAVNFNGDGIVDLADFAKLAQYWGQDEPSVDIGPTLFGDGMVDLRDVAALVHCWLQEIGPIAHWKLDEIEGGVAHDSIGGEDAFGPPNLLWWPEGGKIGGALELDGIDDLLYTTFSLNPADAPFSVFAWVKGGAPGQVIISQSGGANWLMADASEGKLMTELKGVGRFDGPLYSQTVITDGHWHRVGLTWDGSNRILYVDDVEVARDTQAGLAGSNGGLYFGAGKIPVPPSLWLGLLDDIRIYDRAIQP